MESDVQQLYLQSILQRSFETGTPMVSFSDIAAMLDVTSGTVTSMIQRLETAEFVRYTPYVGAELTASGLQEATRFLRKRRLLKAFLQHVLALRWDEIETESERLALATSNTLIDRIESFLDFPEYDPLGLPIPKRDGQLIMPPGTPLSSCQVGDQFKVVCIVHHDLTVLKYLQEESLAPGLHGVVEINQPLAGVMALRLSSRVLSIALRTAGAILVETSEPA